MEIIVHVLVICTCLPIQAGRISNVLQTGGPGGVAAAIPNTVLVNNEDAATLVPSPNTIIIDKTFTAINVIDIQFEVKNTFGITEYFIRDTVVNATPFAWSDYRFELGYGFGLAPPRVGFFIWPNPDQLDFDTPLPALPPPTVFPAGAFLMPPTVQLDDQMVWTAGLGVPPGGLVQFTLSIDVPDSNLFMPLEYASFTGYKFTLRESPSVPEPASWGVSAAALAALVAFSRAKTRRSTRNVN